MTRDHGRLARWYVAIGLAVVVAGAPACASLRAEKPTGGPRLEAPEPPPREVAPPPVEPVAGAPSPVIVPADHPAPRPARPAAGHQRPAPDKSDTAVPPPMVVTVEPLPAKPTDAPGLGAILQTTADASASERRVRVLLTTATRDLAQVKASSLSSAGRVQYDSARRFIAQAENAIRTKNVVFAEQLAAKAAGLAAELRGR